MSLILDALNRADQERSQEQSAPNLYSAHDSATQYSKPVRRWVIEGIVILLVVVAVVYSLFFQRDVPPAQNIDTETVVEQAVPKPVAATSATTPATKDTADQSAANAVQTPPANVAAAKESVAGETGQAGQAGQAETVTQPSVTDPAISSLYQQQADASVDKTPNPEQPAAAAPAPQPVDNSQAILQQIPLLAQMSPRFQNSIPSIDYTVHVYSDSENAGFVNLNGSIRKIGSKIAPGLIVIAILKDSVVLDYNGTQFRLLALNSWVNFN